MPEDQSIQGAGAFSLPSFFSVGILLTLVVRRLCLAPVPL
jgi:hypothetical protein